MSDYTLIPNIDELITELPADSIVSRTIMRVDGGRVVLFGFAPGQELSEHTASKPAILHILRGEAKLTLGDDAIDGGPGTLIHMPAHLPHSVYAVDEVLMLLYLLAPTAKPAEKTGA